MWDFEEGKRKRSYKCNCFTQQFILERYPLEEYIWLKKIIIKELDTLSNQAFDIFSCLYSLQSIMTPYSLYGKTHDEMFILI